MSAPNTPSIQDFLTLQSLLTYGGASTAVLVLTNTVRKLTNFQSPWVPFVFAQLVAFVGATSVNALTGFGAAFLVLLNGCLLFCAALGLNETTNGVTNPPPPGGLKLQGAADRKWLSSWFRRG